MIEAPVARVLIGNIVREGFYTDAAAIQGTEMMAGAGYYHQAGHTSLNERGCRVANVKVMPASENKQQYSQPEADRWLLHTYTARRAPQSPLPLGLCMPLPITTIWRVIKEHTAARGRP